MLVAVIDVNAGVLGVGWLGVTTGESTELERALAYLPDAQEAVREFYAAFWVDHLVDPVLLELVRLRMAMLHRVQSELGLRYDVARDAGLTEEKVQALPDWPTSPMYSELERHVIGLAEQFVIDPHGVTDEDVACIREELTSPGVVALVNAFALIDHLNRLRIAFGTGGAATPKPRVVAAPSTSSPLY